MKELQNLLRELHATQEQLSTAIAASDSSLVTELLDRREPLLQQLGSALNTGSEITSVTRRESRDLLLTETRLQEELQQGLREVNACVKDLSNRQLVLQRYRLRVKPQPRFLDRNG